MTKHAGLVEFALGSAASAVWKIAIVGKRSRDFGIQFGESSGFDRLAWGCRLDCGDGFLEIGPCGLPGLRGTAAGALATA